MFQFLYVVGGIEWSGRLNGEGGGSGGSGSVDLLFMLFAEGTWNQTPEDIIQYIESTMEVVLIRGCSQYGYCTSSRCGVELYYKWEDMGESKRRKWNQVVEEVWENTESAVEEKNWRGVFLDSVKWMWVHRVYLKW